MKDPSKSTGWYLEGYVDRGGVPRRYELKSFPFRIGRSKEADATLPLKHISGFHAEFFEEDGRLWLRDLQSSNGTYLNGRRVTKDTALTEGDIVHFGQCEFLVWVMPDDTSDQAHTMLLKKPASAQRVAAVATGFALRELLAHREVTPVYQPIVGLAYDDFGAGQARLLELVEVPPDYLKFDISLIRDIDKASGSRQKMLETLVHMVKDMGIACVAEGIERVDELDVCMQMGFDYGQGFYLGRPAPVEAWLEDRPSDVQGRDTPSTVAPR